ncbi:DUF4265 domain-containing protein [Spirillospora sp. NPDC049652]
MQRTSKVHVRLTVEGGWPPVAFEELEARPRGDHRFELTSPPAFARRLAVRDVVRVAHHGSPEQVWVESLIEPGGHSTVRVIFFEAAGREPEVDLRRELDRLGARIYETGFQGMISVDIPGGVDFDSARAFLDDGESRNFWEYDEGVISNLHAPAPREGASVCESSRQSHAVGQSSHDALAGLEECGPSA